MSKLYNVILADPPWRFENWGYDQQTGEALMKQRSPDRHYQTMPIDDICKMNIPASDNAVLFLWSCWPLLPEALRVISAWGFEYKTLAWVWVKAKKNGFGFHWGMGYYTRSNSEPCLLATRGSPSKPKDRSIQSVIYESVMNHSRKPDDQYRKIEALYPGANYLEMFARRNRDGWDSFGNEVENSIEISGVSSPTQFLELSREARKMELLKSGQAYPPELFEHLNPKGTSIQRDPNQMELIVE